MIGPCKMFRTEHSTEELPPRRTLLPMRAFTYHQMLTFLQIAPGKTTPEKRKRNNFH